VQYEVMRCKCKKLKRKKYEHITIANYNGLKPLPKMWPPFQPCRCVKHYMHVVQKHHNRVVGFEYAIH
jgi:hypothetical protein